MVQLHKTHKHKREYVKLMKYKQAWKIIPVSFFWFWYYTGATQDVTMEGQLELWERGKGKPGTSIYIFFNCESIVNVLWKKPFSVHCTVNFFHLMNPRQQLPVLFRGSFQNFKLYLSCNVFVPAYLTKFSRKCKKTCNEFSSYWTDFPAEIKQQKLSKSR